MKGFNHPQVKHSKYFLGHTDLVQHKINTGSAVPIKQSLRRLPYGKRQTEKEKILRMLDLGVIEPLHLPGDVNTSFNLMKACSHSSFHWNIEPFSHILCNGLAMIAKFFHIFPVIGVFGLGQSWTVLTLSGLQIWYNIKSIQGVQYQ
jgi:hypothetical protein